MKNTTFQKISITQDIRLRSSTTNKKLVANLSGLFTILLMFGMQTVSYIFNEAALIAKPGPIVDAITIFFK